MDRLKTTLFTAFVISILFAPAASAQATAAKVQVISGNGQMICPSCAFKRFTFFYPMAVKVTDANGNPIAGKTVNWQLVSTIGTLPVFDATTFTDSNGLSVSRLYQAGQGASLGIPFIQSVISASADGIGVNFTETIALSDVSAGLQVVFSRLDAPLNGALLSGPAGGTGTDPIRIHVDGRGTGVPNVSVRILNSNDPTVPSASCVTGPGADPGSVLTDLNGDGVCFPVFGPNVGRGAVSALLGGLDPKEFDQTISPQPLPDPIAFDQYQGIQLSVSAVTPGLLNIVSGNNQSVNPGQSSAALVVKLTDVSGAVPIANSTVVWTISPAGQATLSQTQTTTNASGQTQVAVIFASSATGAVTVRAALTGSNSAISATFNLATNVQIASMTKISGDPQSTQAGQSFGAPLIVQLNGTNGLPVPNQPVSFGINGNGTLSATSVLTDALGRAQVTVRAGNTPGTLTVTAAIGNISQVFTLTIIPPGPNLSTSVFYNAGGLTKTSALSPCSMATVITSGLAPNVQGMIFNVNAFGPWVTTLATVSATVGNIAAPIYSVGNVNGVEQLTFQVPCEVAPASSVPVTINVGGGTGTVNMPVQAATPGIYETVMSDGARRGVVIRPDGTFVSLQNPARRGEVVRVYVTGMGPAAPALATGALPVPGADSLVLGQVIVGVNNAGARVVTSRVSPNLLGVYELAFQIPSDAPTGNDVVLSVAVNAPGDSQTRFSNGSKLPIQ